MKPNHDGQEPQQGKSYHHFTILKDGAYIYGPGDKVNISLFVPDDSFSKFKGFMIQVIEFLIAQTSAHYQHRYRSFLHLQACLWLLKLGWDISIRRA
jgi:hypothetical protein